jgi:hypothetical protein
MQSVSVASIVGLTVTLVDAPVLGSQVFAAYLYAISDVFTPDPVDKAIIDYLTDLSALSVLDYTQGDQIYRRIYADFTTQDIDPPFVVYALEKGSTNLTHSGPSGLLERQYKFDIWTIGQGANAQASAIGLQLRAALHGYIGSMGAINYLASRFLDEDRTRDAQTMQIHLTQRYHVWYQET